MLTSITQAITSGVESVISTVTSSIPTAFDNLFTTTDGKLTAFAEVTFYFIGFGISIGLARWLASKVN